MSTVRHLGYFPIVGEFALDGWPSDNPDTPPPKPCPHLGIPTYAPFAMFPYGMALADAMYAYWVVREYTLTVSLTLTPTSPPGPPVPMNETRIIAMGAVTETDMVCGTSFNIDPPEFLWFAYMFQAPSDFLSPPDPVWGPNLVLSGGLYYPQMYFRYGDSLSEFPYTFSTSPYNFSGGSLELKSAVFSSSFFGGTIPLYGETGFDATGTVTLEPSLYWSYDGTWDTVTGARL